MILQAELHETALRLTEKLDTPVEVSPKKESGFTAFLTANAPLVAWLVFLGFGGALLTFYYFQISYFPDLEWNQAFGYLAAMSLLGGIMAATYSFLLFFPGVIWSEFLIFDTRLREHFCYTSHNEPCFLTVWRDLAVPFAVFMVAVHLAMLWNLLAVSLMTVAGLVVLIIFYSLKFKAIARTSEIFEKSPEKSSRLVKHAAKPSESDSRQVKYVATAVVAALLSAASLLFLYFLVNPEGDIWALLIVCTLFVVASNLLVAIQFRNKPQRAVLTGVVAALMLMCLGEILSGENSALSIRIMERFGLRENVTLVVTDVGRGTITGNGLDKNLIGLDGALHNVRILSKLGSQYYIEVQNRRVAIPKDQVLSWSTEKPKPN